jgi:Flp pilus assembly protein TadD
MSEKNGGAEGKPDVEALRAEIKQTRSELGETVQALAAKADVKARAKEQVEVTKQRVKAQAAEATGKVREAAHQAGERVRNAATLSAHDSDPEAEPAPGLRPNPVAIGAVIAGLAAVVGVILIVRGRRR